MGFWGLKVAGRTESELLALPAVIAVGGDPDGEWAEPSGWRLASAHGSGPFMETAASAAAAQAGGPVLLAFVADSDTAQVFAASPGQAVVSCILNPAGAEGYGMPVDPAEQSAAADALAEMFGAGADVELTRAALAGNLVFAEDSFLRLAAALGAFSQDRLSELVFGSLDELEL